MKKRIETAAVLGAGVMGSAIAAHLAGAGIKTYLLDILPPNLDPGQSKLPQARNAFALSGIDKTLKAKPQAFYTADAAKLIVAGNFEDDLHHLAECDVVIEAIVEKLDVKQSLFHKVAKYLPEHALLASNTSGLSIAAMSEGLPVSLQERFVILHFFNPVRYMHLLEIVAGPKTSPQTVAQAARLGEFLGKGVVYGKDTPNFVGNRIGIYSIMKAISAMTSFGLSFEEVDKVFGKPLGHPASAAFRTADIVGLDTFAHVAQHCYDSLPNDEERQIFQLPAYLKALIKEGRLGQKSGAGFYKKAGPDILVLDENTLSYRPQKKVRFDSLAEIRSIEEAGPRIKAFLEQKDKAAQYAWHVLAHILCYSARRLGEIADDIINIDRAMRWGFNWDLGPFETWDAIGVRSSVERMTKEGIEVPKWVLNMLEQGREYFYEGPARARTYYDKIRKTSSQMPKDPHHIDVAALHEDSKKIIKENLGASLIDVGDGCLLFEVHTKMNTLDDDVIGLLNESIDIAEHDYDALVIGNDGLHFGAGANLMLIYMAAQQGQWEQLHQTVRAFQSAMQKVKYAKVPTVGAPFQYTFGGALELCLACDALQAHAESYMGLVEVGVGLVPAGSGCLRLVERFTAGLDGLESADLLPAIGQASLQIATAKVATGAEDARKLRYLLERDGISLNKDHLLYHAKQRALGLARAGYRPPLPRSLPALGLDGARTIGMRVWSMLEGGYISEHDALIANEVAFIVSGGAVSRGSLLDDQHFLDLEREAFIKLAKTEKTQARMQSILLNNKPLRN